MSDVSNAFVEMFDVEKSGAPSATLEPPVEVVEPAELVVGETDTQVPVAPVAPVEPAEPLVPVELTEDQLWAGKYKTPEDMEIGLRELQSHKDREIAQINAKLEAYESLLNSSPEPEPQMIQVSGEELEAGIDQAPVDTFQWAMQNRPDLIPNVIGLVRDKHGNVPADQMQATYNNAMIMAQQEHFQNQMNQAFAPQQMQQGFSQAIDYVQKKYGEEFDTLRDETVKELSQLGGLESYDPETVALAIEYSFLNAYRNNARQAATNNTAPVVPSPLEFVEAGAPGQGAPKLSKDDAVRSEIEEAFSKMWK